VNPITLRNNEYVDSTLDRLEIDSKQVKLDAEKLRRKSRDLTLELEELRLQLNKSAWRLT